NKEAGSRRMLAHFTFTPGWPGWLDQVDEAVERFKPDSWKGYTVGDNTHKELAHHPWHADDEKLMYPFYEKIAKTGIKNVCIHKDMQKKNGCKPLGPADGPVKTAIFSGNSARLHGLEKHAAIVQQDRFAALKADYNKNGPGRSNLRYGYVARQS